jgi:hypothetical protein
VSAQQFTPGDIARLRTNRCADAEVAKTLHDGRIDLDRVPTEPRRLIEAELGGAAAAKAFFETFAFSHSEPLIENLEAQLKGLIVPTDTDTSGWLLLRQQARIWATKKLQPEPDGRIRHEHLVQIITKKRAQPMPQSFQVPGVYFVPNAAFHDGFLDRIRGSQKPLCILWGSPGRGKSTYLSFLIEALRKKKHPVVRHHYFLSLSDTTVDRVSFADIAMSLMDQMLARYSDAVRGLEQDPVKLRKWIEACGRHFSRGRARPCLERTGQRLSDGSFVQLPLAMLGKCDLDR